MCVLTSAVVKDLSAIFVCFVLRFELGVGKEETGEIDLCQKSFAKSAEQVWEKWEKWEKTVKQDDKEKKQKMMAIGRNAGARQ